MGMVVSVETADGSALRINFQYSVIGPVQAIDPLNQSLTVLGQTVFAEELTLYEPHVSTYFYTIIILSLTAMPRLPRLLLHHRNTAAVCRLRNVPKSVPRNFSMRHRKAIS